MGFNYKKNCTLLGLLRFSLSFLFAGAVINRVNLAFQTNIIEDTHLTLAVIPFEGKQIFNVFANIEISKDKNYVQIVNNSA